MTTFPNLRIAPITETLDELTLKINSAQIVLPDTNYFRDPVFLQDINSLHKAGRASSSEALAQYARKADAKNIRYDGLQIYLESRVDYYKHLLDLPSADSAQLTEAVRSELNQTLDYFQNFALIMKRRSVLSDILGPNQRSVCSFFTDISRILRSALPEYEVVKTEHRSADPSLVALSITYALEGSDVLILSTDKGLAGRLRSAVSSQQISGRVEQVGIIPKDGTLRNLYSSK